MNSSNSIKLMVLALLALVGTAGCSDQPYTGGGPGSSGGGGTPSSGGGTPSGGGGTSSGGGGSTPYVGQAPANYILLCGVRINPAIVSYVVNDDRLDITTSGGQTSSATRVRPTTGTADIRGTWQLPPESVFFDLTEPVAFGERFSGTLTVDAANVTLTHSCSCNWATIEASASSPAQFTATTFTTTESHEEVRQWTPAGGPTTLETLSVGHQAPPTMKARLTFPPIFNPN